MNTRERKNINTFDIFKMVIGWILTFILRLLPFRVPNVEPILMVQAPFTKQFGWLAGFSFAFLSIFLFDVIVGKVGLWTIVTAMAYGLLALFSHWYFKNRKGSSKNFAIHAIYATLIYDALTGLTMGPIFFHQSFMSAVTGQAIFTIYHLTGNVLLAFLFSPAIYHYLVMNPKFSLNYLKQKLALSN